MFDYSMIVSQIIDGKRKLTGDGYILKGNNKSIRLENLPDDDFEVISEREIEEIIYDGCVKTIREFATSADNKDVYCFSLDINEHNDVIIYINTEEKFNKTLQYYQSKYEKYHKEEYIRGLKYGLGDFEYMYYDMFTGRGKEIMDEYKDILEFINEGNLYLAQNCRKRGRIYCGKLFENALYSICGKVFNRLQGEFDGLNKTEDFIAFLSTGDDYIDYSLSIKNCIGEEMFYRIFPEMEKEDLQYKEEVETWLDLSPVEKFEKVYDECSKNTHRTDQDIFSKTTRTEYHGIKFLEENLTYKETLNILTDVLENKEGLDDKIAYDKCFILVLTLVNISGRERLRKTHIKRCMLLTRETMKDRDYRMKVLELVRYLMNYV